MTWVGKYTPWAEFGVWVSLPWLLVLLGGHARTVEAIVQHPSKEQVEKAVERGSELAKNRRPPIELYAHFGSSGSLDPQGFLMTKLGGVAVMAGHFALRGERPSALDIERILGEKDMQVVVTVYGPSPTFARESYLLLKQGERIIKPARIRVDGRAVPVEGIVEHGAFRAKIVASFGYGSFDPQGKTLVSVFPGTGGETDFLLDFSSIP